MSNLRSRVQRYRASRLTEQKLGLDNAISSQLAPRRSGIGDGRRRFPRDVRQAVYRHLVHTIRRTDTELEIGLCLEESEMAQMLHSELRLGRCNCVL
jgi:hypothetical protein